MTQEGAPVNYGIQVSGGSIAAKALAVGYQARAEVSGRSADPRQLHEVARQYDRAAGPERKQFDVFISHASEDQDAVASPLAEALTELGLTVWFDDSQLTVGDSLRMQIDAGVLNSRFGVVILSSKFFAKGWTQYELNGMVTLAATGKQYLLPIWHGITQDEILKYSPSLADMVALDTSELTIAQIAERLAGVVQTNRP